ncbi:MAG: hypothetical protein LLF98_02155 [Clostridium sp.]|uniref:hypothetical protein n=1 Tax=Clostridium sp. TaxID=1506 RepID=UPI0025C336B9|nr:hypothetical protein [Clostridium sp.]MCE5220085.1 hypothetical protein [Clostridium sp.]
MSEALELQHLSLTTTYEVDESFDSEKYIKMRLRVCHDGVNPNKSAFVVSDMENAKGSIKNIPILANVIFDEDGQPQFGGHDMELESSKVKEGEYKLIYKEVPIGLIPETCNHEISEYNGKNYVFVDGYVWKEYSNYAQDIIERDEDVKLSMEILVDAYNFNAKEKVFNITDYRYQGITFLNKDLGTGMENALATTGTFEENTKQRFILMMEELKETLSNYDINKTEEGGSKVDEKIITLLSEYKVNQEELPFNIEEMQFEEIEEKLKELYSNNNLEEDNNEPEKFIKSFELSHSEIRYALYQLLSPIENEDNEWYFVDQVYDDRFEYENWEGTKIYRQGYKKEDDIVSFEGDRVELFQERLTKEEKDNLDKMRSNYSALEAEVEKLREFQQNVFTEVRKEAEDTLFSQFDEKLKGVEEYEKLKETASEFELKDLEKECYVILGMKSANFSAKPKDKNKNDKVRLDFGKVDVKTNDVDEFIEKYSKR